MRISIAIALALRCARAMPTYGAATSVPAPSLTVLGKGCFQTVRCELRAGSKWRTMSGALVSWSGEVDVQAMAKPLSAMAGGTSLFLTELQLKSGLPEGAVGSAEISPGLPGEILVLDAAQGWLVSDGSFLAAEAGVDIGVRSQSFTKAVFTKSGFFVLSVGPSAGKVLVSGFGTISTIRLAKDESVRVDTKHLVAWSRSMDSKIVKGSSAGKMASVRVPRGRGARAETFRADEEALEARARARARSLSSIPNQVLAGETTALKFYGPGIVYVHSHNIQSLAKRLPAFSVQAGSGSSSRSSSDD